MNDPNDLARAEQFLELGRYAEAETLLRALLADHPGSVEVLHALATVLLFAERNEESLELARQALTLAPEDLDCRLAVCDALIQLERGPEALGLAEAAIITDPDDWRSWFAHARALGSLPMPRVRDALDSINRAIGLHPHSADLHAFAGVLLEVLGLRDLARSAFTEALRLDPQHTAALTSLADLDAGLFRLRRSAANVRAAVGADAQDNFAHGGVATLAGRLARRLLLALVVAGIVVGLEVYGGASFLVRGATGVAALALCGLLVRSSLHHLPRGMTRSAGALWGGVGTGTKVLLGVCVVITICLCVMAFAPTAIGSNAGLVFLRVVRILLMLTIFVCVFQAVALLFIRKK
jgi:tetratricopeptide (TPR) repeat protein